MLKIRQLQKQKKDDKKETVINNSIDPAKIRVQKDLSELNLPNTINIIFPSTKDIMNFEITIVPNEGYYKDGLFKFKCEINSNYPIQPPKLKCLNKIYHPNIDLDGNICLNILREDWSPVLTLNAIIIGLQFLFLDPNPNDPLNKTAANDLNKDVKLFKRNVTISMRGGKVGDDFFDRVI